MADAWTAQCRTVAEEARTSSIFRDWVRAHRVLAAAALLVALPNVELLTLMSCHATAELDLLWLDSPMAERKLASLGYLSLLRNVPQVRVTLPCRHNLPAAAEGLLNHMRGWDTS